MIKKYLTEVINIVNLVFVIFGEEFEIHLILSQFVFSTLLL